jgi:dihydrofolate reductase
VSKEQDIHVFAMAALSKDGFIGQDEGHVSTNWTSDEDKDWFWERTKQAGAVVMGSTTFFATRKPGWPLPDRMNFVLTRDPEGIWDRYESRKEAAAIKQKDNLLYLTASPQKLINQVANNFSELAVCGGTSVYTKFLPLIETFYLTREPVELGEGLPLIGGMSPTELEAMLNKEFELAAEEQLNKQGTVLQTWQRKEA